MRQTHDFMRAPVVLHAISSFDDRVLDQTAPTIVQGLTAAISASSSPLRNEITKSPDFWSTLQRLHQHKTEAENVANILALLATSPGMPEQALTADNFESAIGLANDFASAGSIGSIQEKRRDFAAKQGRKAKDAKPEDTALVQRANKAVTLIYQLTDRVPALIDQSHLPRAEAWAAYWSPIFRALCSQCVNPCREIRYRALSALQRTLLSENVADPGHKEHTEWTAIFDEVLFPLTLRLLKPEVYQLDPVGMNETRAALGGLLCKVFLRYLDRLAEIPVAAATEQDSDEVEPEEDGKAEITTSESQQSPISPVIVSRASKAQQQPKGTKLRDIYLKTLTLLDRLMNAGTIDPKSQSVDALAEAVREGVKNTVLVMDGAGYLHRPTSAAPGTKASQLRTSGDGVSNGEEVDIWTETVRRLERFLPGLIDELFPASPPPGGEEKGNAKDGVQQGTGKEGREEMAKAAPIQGSRPQTRDGEKK
jgi:golgi-specific brefeldin A-resistance guanine nucleotide exchange factor 1